jgi:hypothetical protein
MGRSELAGAERELLDPDAATLGLGDARVVVDGKASTRTVSECLRYGLRR